MINKLKSKFLQIFSYVSEEPYCREQVNSFEALLQDVWECEIAKNYYLSHRSFKVICNLQNPNKSQTKMSIITMHL